MYLNFISVILAVIIDWIVGDPYGFPHPVIYIGKFIRFLEKKFRKIAKTRKQLKLYGGVIVILVAGVTFLLPFIILRLTRSNPILYCIVNTTLIWTTLACKCLNKEAMKVYNELSNNNLSEARLKLSYIVGRETEFLSEKEVIRADVETVAENASDGVIAPLICAMIFGAPLAMMYKGINTMDSMLGYLTKKYKDIGYFPAKVDDVFNFIPARITGFFMCLISPLVGGNILRSLKIMVRDRKNHKSPNCAYPEAATAGAMGVLLGGTNTYFGEVIEKPTMGDKIQELGKRHIKKSIHIMYLTEIFTLVVYVIIEARILGYI
ncbi:adenosylcobinamide-phosphate synthase CbiB [Haloimpatiens sp. FM7315]|uniref:adenosylcobinamide-phosphate synthase CbiB n=1 Tax=Haloimpatiens sp. FM7315 TaxID=3298609 RepID=UPI0035A39FB6